jgi:hypothetical protein
MTCCQVALQGSIGCKKLFMVPLHRVACTCAAWPAGLLRLLSEAGVAVPPPHRLNLADPRLLAWLLEPQLLQVGPPSLYGVTSATAGCSRSRIFSLSSCQAAALLRSSALHHVQASAVESQWST